MNLATKGDVSSDISVPVNILSLWPNQGLWKHKYAQYLALNWSVSFNEQSTVTYACGDNASYARDGNASVKLSLRT